MGSFQAEEPKVLKESLWPADVVIAPADTVELVLPAQRDRLPGIRSVGLALSAARSGLHLESAGSSLRTAESCSSSYGLHVRLGLLPTPPRGDAFSSDYRERPSPGGGLSPLCSRLLPGARIPGQARDDSLGALPSFHVMCDEPKLSEDSMRFWKSPP
jgi:hypothetical protein